MNRDERRAAQPGLPPARRKPSTPGASRHRTAAHRSRRAVSPLLFAALVACAGCAIPRVYPPATALLHDDAADNPDGRVLLALTGRGFGARSVSGGVRLRDGDGRLLLDLRAADRARVPLWTEQRIVVVAPAAIAGVDGLSVAVATGVVRSLPAPVAFFSYQHVDVPRSDPRTNASPLAIAVDAGSRVVVNEEFHTQLKRFDPAAGWQIYDLPRGPGAAIFASELFGDDRSALSMLGESVVVDPSNRAWATQGGWMLYAGAHPNHSRIIMLPPDGGAPRVWPVPGDDNSAVGIAYDPATGRVWFTQARRARRAAGVEHVAYPARLTSFDPRRIPPDPDFDFAARERCALPAGAHVGVCSTTRTRRCLDDDDCLLADRVCRADAPDDDRCFREYPIPTPPGEAPLALPGPLLRHADGTIWFAGYLGGNAIGRFDPTTQRFQHFPLPRPPGEASCDLRACGCFPSAGGPQRPCPQRCCLYLLIGRGPWGLAEDADGNLAFCAQEAGAVSLLPKSRFDDARCATLDPRGANPCLTDVALPNYDVEHTQLHSLVRDDAGNLWFGESRVDGIDATPASGAALGYVQANSGRVILLPPPSLYPFLSNGADCRPAGEPVAFSATGIAYDARSGAVWAADYCRKRLGRFVPRPPRDAR